MSFVTWNDVYQQLWMQAAQSRGTVTSVGEVPGASRYSTIPEWPRTSGADAIAIASLVDPILNETPLRPGGSLLALKVLPLVIPLAGLWKNRMYTYRWVSLMIWLYFTEGVVRAWSDTNGVGQVLALVEVLLCLVLFAACAWHVRLRLRHAKNAARQLEASAQ